MAVSFRGAWAATLMDIIVFGEVLMLWEEVNAEIMVVLDSFELVVLFRLTIVMVGLIGSDYSCEFLEML